MILQALIALLACWINKYQEHVIAYIQEENRLLKAQLQGRRLNLTENERRRLAVLTHPIDRHRLKDMATIATVDTLQRWYRLLLDQQADETGRGQKPGRPRVATEIEHLVVRMAEENVSWGYRRLQGALSNLGYSIDKITVRNILRRHHIDPAPQRRQTGMSWDQLLKLHWEVCKETGVGTHSMETLTQMWTSALKLGLGLVIPCLQRLGRIHKGLRAVITAWEPPVLRLAFERLLRPQGWLRDPIGQYARSGPRRAGGRHRRRPEVQLVSSSSATRQPVKSRVPPQRDPPPVTYPELRIAPRGHVRERSMSEVCLLLLCRADSARDRRQSQHQDEDACTNSVQAAA